MTFRAHRFVSRGIWSSWQYVRGPARRRQYRGGENAYHGSATGRRYSATLTLPSGAYLRYKYTLGDGYWNAERSIAGGFEVRELIVPDQDATIQDNVRTWNSGDSSPILFETTVAATRLLTTSFLSSSMLSAGRSRSRCGR